MNSKLFILITLLSVIFMTCGELRAQILFEDLHSVTPTMDGSIGKKSIQMAPTQPIRPMVAPSRPGAPMPKFKHTKIAPDRIMMSPIERNTLKKHQMRTKQITFNPMIRTNIKPQGITINTLIPPIHTMERMSVPPPIEKPHWSFNPTLQGRPQATTRFDSSIKAPMRDYDSPYYPDVPATASHPMAW